MLGPHDRQHASAKHNRGKYGRTVRVLARFNTSARPFTEQHCQTSKHPVSILFVCSTPASVNVLGAKPCCSIGIFNPYRRILCCRSDHSCHGRSWREIAHGTSGSGMAETVKVSHQRDTYESPVPSNSWRRPHRLRSSQVIKIFYSAQYYHNPLITFSFTVYTPFYLIHTLS